MEIDWTESEGDTDENLELQGYRDSSEDEQEFRAAGRDGTRARRTRDEQLDPEVEEAYQVARNLYTSGDYQSALVLLEEAIKHESGSKLLFNLLVSIHEERQDMEKALLARIAVAHLDKRDKDTWIDIAERSVQLGHLQQAAVFFQHVSRIDRGNWTWLRTRASLHTQLGEPQTALSLFQRIRTKYFAVLNHTERTEILLNIASALRDVGRVDEATNIYLNIFNRSLGLDTSNTEGNEVELDWQNLNVLCELLFEQKKYQQVISLTKDGARWIRGRSNEKCWGGYNLQSDAEFDKRRIDLVKQMSPAQRSQISDLMADQQYDLPIDIRLWLLESRLKLVPSHFLLESHSLVQLESQPYVQDALNHLAILRTYKPVEDYSDLYNRAALAFFETRLYAEARELYIYLTGIAHESEEEYLDMTVQVAKCEMELQDLTRAENLYKFVLERDPRNQEALVAMCEIYSATGRVTPFQDTLTKLEVVRSSHAVEDDNESPSGITGDASDHNVGNIFVGNTRVRAPGARMNRAEKAEVERSALERAEQAFSGLSRYQSGLDLGNAVAIMEWLRFADELVDMFASHRKFFPADRQKEFFSFKGSSRSSVDQRMRQLQLARDDQIHDVSDDEGMDADNEGDVDVDMHMQQPTREELEESFMWHGRPLSFWFLVLMQCALVHAKAGNGKRAQQVVNIAQAANVFSLNSERSETMDFVGLSCAYRAGDFATVSSLVRHLQVRSQFNTMTFKLYIALLSSGSSALEVFAASNNQKFFLRQIKALDSVVHANHAPIGGMAKILDPETVPERDDPHLLMLYVYMMLQGPSYAPALVYLIRCREQLRNHPLVLLVYGIIQSQRAIQRTSKNRHLQILEGLSFMQDYAKQRASANEKRQEVLYNLGRFFHGAGLLTPAARYYEQALELSGKADEKYNMAKEAAYNLQLIYMQSDAPQLSKNIIDKYLTI